MLYAGSETNLNGGTRKNRKKKVRKKSILPFIFILLFACCCFLPYPTHRHTFHFLPPT